LFLARGLSPQAEMASPSMSAYTVLMIAAWYFSNIGVILLNKYLLSVWGFKFPIFLTACHMVACLSLSFAVRASGIAPRQALKSRRHLVKVAVLAVVFVASVVGGNVSLRFIPVSFNQAIGATTPFFTALLSLFIMRQKETGEVYVTLLPIVLGIVLASRAEPSFHLTGFVACVSATFSRALKSVLQGLLLTNDAEKLDSLNLLLYMSPVALGVLVAATSAMEPEAFGFFLENCAESPHFFFVLGLNCVLAFSVNLTNFLVTKCTSPLTLQVLGNAKGAVAVVVSILLFKNPVSGMGMLGYSITIMGVVAYSEAKKRSKEKMKRREDLELTRRDGEGKGSAERGALLERSGGV
jgi:drug/metabolite transporter (DMT)-like permease